MEKLKKKKLKTIFFITKKQFLFSIFLIKIIFFTFINSSNIENSSKILKFKINGDITISDNKDNNIIETTKLNSPLIYTKINEKNINFKDNNILPTQNGELNYIDIYLPLDPPISKKYGFLNWKNIFGSSPGTINKISNSKITCVPKEKIHLFRFQLNQEDVMVIKIFLL